jgi:hypothetical protein
MPQPLLHLGDIRAVCQSVRCCCCSERMHTEAVHVKRDPHLFAVAPDDGGPDALGPMDHQDVHWEADQLRRQRGEAIEVPFGVAHLEEEVLW